MRAGIGLDVFAHNLETVERLQRRVRDHRAGYKQSLSVLEHAKAVMKRGLTKTSLMLGCGETDEDIKDTLKDLRAIDVDVVTFGQYLRPSRRHMPVRASADLMCMYERVGSVGPVVHLPFHCGCFFTRAQVKEFVTPEKFQEWQEIAEGMGFKYVASGPLVRSSYKAGEFYLKALVEAQQTEGGDA